MSDDKTRIISAAEGVGPGTQLNGIYEIDEHIASGGMGEVYRGHNIQTDETVAIKIVLPEYARDKTMLALFRKEATVLSRLAADAIVRYHVFTVEPALGRPYLAMEYVDGVSLADVLARGPMDASTSARLIARIASGLGAAHNAGIIHRDLSPDNIILPGGRVEEAKIIDFGIAKATVGGGTLLGGKFAGKYNFVSPEQLGDFGGEVTARSDIYSLGLVLAAVLRGETLDMSGSQVEVIEKRRRMPDISMLAPELLPLLHAMLQPDPANRPPSMEAVVEWVAGSGLQSASQNGQGAARTSWAPPTSGETSYAPTGIGGRQTSLAPDIGTGSTPPASGSTPPAAGSNPPGATVFVGSQPSYVPLTGSTPPANAQAGSTPPAHAGSTPPSGSVPPAYGQAELPALAGSVPPTAPTSESPFGAYVPEPAAGRPASPPAQPGPRRKSSAPLYAAAAVVLIALVGGGGYFAGLFGPGGNTPAPAATPPSLAPATPAPAPKPKEQAAATPPATETPATPPAGGTTAEATTPPVEEPAPTSDQVAGLPPPVEPAPVPEPPKIDKAVEQVDWLKNYAGGACFYASATNVTNTSISIEGFGTSATPFEAMLAKFKDATKIEPDIGVRLIEKEQCAVADFLQALRNSPEDRPELSLSTDLIKSGEAIRGSLGNLDGRKTDVLLVDNAGVVYNLAGHLRQAGENASFNIKLGLATETAVPQMIVAVSSPTGLDAAKVSQPVLAEKLFPEILAEISDKKIAAAATAEYFKLGG